MKSITASDRNSLIRLASSLPKGDKSRRAILVGLKKAEDWIDKAVEEPGRLHKYFGIPDGEKIPVSKIDAEIKKLKSKDDRTEEETSLLRALNLAKTLKKMGGGKKAGRNDLSAFQARAVFMQFGYPEEYWHPSELPDDRDVDIDEAEDILRAEGLEEFERGMGYDEDVDEDDIDVGEVYGTHIDDSELEEIYEDIEEEEKRKKRNKRRSSVKKKAESLADLPDAPMGYEWEDVSDLWGDTAFTLYRRGDEVGSVVDQGRNWVTYVAGEDWPIGRGQSGIWDAGFQLLDHLGLA